MVNMISRGADFIIPNANAAGIGVIQAVREAGPDICNLRRLYRHDNQPRPNKTSWWGPTFADYADGVVRIVAGIKNGSLSSQPPNIVFRIEGIADCDQIHLT